VNVVKGFDDALVAVGVPSGISRPLFGEHLDIRVYPQIKPVVIDWIRNFRTRLSPGMPWQTMKWSFQGIAKSSGEQPELVVALVAEFKNLLDVDFEGVIPPEEYDEEYRKTFLENFSLAIVFAAGPDDYDTLRELVVDPRSIFCSWSLMSEYFVESDSDDLPALVAEMIGTSAQIPAVEIAARHGMVQFLPAVRQIVKPNTFYVNSHWTDTMRNSLDRLEKKSYADSHVASSVDDLVRGLDDDSVAPYAAHLLGVRKDRRAFGPLQAKAAHEHTHLRQEAKRALDAIDRHHLNSGVGERDAEYRPDFLVSLDAFFEDLLGAGVPSAGARSQADVIVHPDMRVYPQIEPVLIDWIGSFRSRIEREFLWPLFLWKIHGIVKASGEQPGLVRALLAELWNLVELDFTEFETPDRFEGDPQRFKLDFVQNFTVAIICASSAADYPELRKVVFDDKGRNYCLFLLLDYFGLEDNDDVPMVLREAMKVPDYSVRWAVAHVAAIRGFTQFLPFVRELQNDPETARYAGTGADTLKSDIYALERALYVENNETTSVEDLIGDLKRREVAPFAAYTLGQRKDPSALRHLKRRTRSFNSRLRHEAKAALGVFTAQKG